MNSLFNQLKEILLIEDKKYQYLINYCETNIKNIKNDKSIKEIEQYLNGLNSFFNKYVKELKQYRIMISYNYFNFLNIFHEYVSKETYSANYLTEYRKSVTRTMELVLFLQLKDFEVNRLIFNKNKETFYHQTA